MSNQVYILLDRSGSMDTMWKEALDGINSYVEKLSDTGAEVTLAAFDAGPGITTFGGSGLNTYSNLSYDIIRKTKASDWKPVTREDVTPRGGTPLLDAAGRIIQTMMDSKAERAILVVVTDGYENASTKYKASEIKEMTKQLTTKYGYDTVFIGANFDGIGDVISQNFGINDAGKFMSSSVRGFGAAMNASAAATANYLATGQEVKYSAEDKTKAKA